MKKIITSLLLVATLFTLTACSGNKTAEITEVETQTQMLVMFEFPNEVVDITFISPDGTEYEAFNIDDIPKDVEDKSEYYEENKVLKWQDDELLMATYRVNDAEVGTWSVSYDKGENEGISYNIQFPELAWEDFFGGNE